MIVTAEVPALDVELVRQYLRSHGWELLRLTIKTSIYTKDLGERQWRIHVPHNNLHDYADFDSDLSSSLSTIALDEHRSELEIYNEISNDRHIAVITSSKWQNNSAEEK